MVSTPPLRISLRNHTENPNVFAVVTGLDSNRGNVPFFLQSDGASLYYPTSPPNTGTSLAVDVNIPVGGVRAARTITIPTYFAGGRVYFCVGSPLTFMLNPGPGVVEPSPSNNTDPNHDKEWDFMELSFNSTQVFGNITYVDFVSVPIALSLYTNDGAAPQHVTGSNQFARANVAAGLREQDARDHAGWSKLIVPGPNGLPLRIVSPNTGIAMNSALFANYYNTYINHVWSRFRNQGMTINTQASFGDVTGQVAGNGYLSFKVAPGAFFNKPQTRDIFSCSTGPFATNANAERNAIIPRLAAAFNRTTLLLSSTFPNGANPAQFYQNTPTNHYSRIVHANNIDGKGYAFPYDDVTGDGQADQAGTVSGPPELLIVAVGGNGAGLTAAPVIPE